jgi:hypothetical protein
MSSITTREETVLYIKGIMDDKYDLPVPKGRWHFGYVELRMLLDYIYKSEPENDKQRLVRD